MYEYWLDSCDSLQGLWVGTPLVTSCRVSSESVWSRLWWKSGGSQGGAGPVCCSGYSPAHKPGFRSQCSLQHLALVFGMLRCEGGLIRS